MIEPPISGSLSNENGVAGDRIAARRRFLAWRQQIGEAERRQWDTAIVERVWQWLNDPSASPARHADRLPVIAAYWPIQSEPDLRELFERIWDAGWTLALPVVRKRAQPMAFSVYLRNGPLRTAGFGVQVPEQFVETRPDVLVAPCVGFRADGYRLGYGGGYYDRTLAELSVATVGVAYDGCEWPAYVPQAHDRRLDRIITPSR